MRGYQRGLALACLLSLSLSAAATQTRSHTEGLPWTGTWAVGQLPVTRADYGNLVSLTGQTLRQYVYTSIGGRSARLHFSNQYGETPLTLADVHVGLNDDGGSILDGTDHVVTFDGGTTAVLQPGESIVSDAIDMTVPANAYLAVSTYFPVATPKTYTIHPFTEQTMQMNRGDVSGKPFFDDPTFPGDYYFLTGVDVRNPDTPGSLVAIGTSITDGDFSSGDQNRRWPNDLSRRLAAQGIPVGVLNKGVSGGNLLDDAPPLYGESTLNRYSRDVIDQPNVRWVIHTDFNGLSDTNAPQLIAAVQSLMDQAHANHVKFVCGTYTPTNEAPGTEATRQRYNAFLRSSPGCDALVDFDAALRDPDHPSQLQSRYKGSDDGVHPNDAGYQAMADAVNLAIFQAPTAPPVSNPQQDCDAGLTTGQTITTEKDTLSCDGRFMLALQEDDNFVLYRFTDDGGVPLWATGSLTDGTQRIASGQMLHNGNFMFYDTAGKAVWATNTDGHPGSRMLLQNDGNLVIYDPTGFPVWNTGTQLLDPPAAPAHRHRK
ncbi:GDSL-type esterase/lipase family protein [Luteibacter aegosomatis]|uniref:GDSL-type esterase/lipase family protein n=1 Tax=Luteibacter aegosomatis TaxID=2911537 RepID=UPI001FFBFBA3|nr:GDSL-type esterase/lipase family protein [Luteibacter aegosomatis]UPG84202.1 GDSL-type esterase/lipase family protein [Luteibacter aegosomatis]